MDVRIERALTADAEEILILQKLAYRSEAELYRNYGIEPLVQTIEQLKLQFQNHTVLKAVSDGSIVGSVRAYAYDGTCFIGKLIVHPGYQGRGIGTTLMNAIETIRPAGRYELFTGSKSETNIRLYHRLGYRIFKYEIVEPDWGLVFLEKNREIQPL